MADRPIPSHAGRTSSSEAENWQDYSGAMRTIRAARRLFLLLLVLSLLTHGAAYGLARWTQLLCTTEAVEQDAQAASTPEAPGSIDLEEPAEPSTWLHYPVRTLLPLSEFVGQLSCGVLLLCYLLAANVALSGRLGGVRGSLSAFFWVLVLLALLFPWHRWLDETPGRVQVPGVYVTFDEIMHLPSEFADRSAEVFHYVRFLGYPLLALLIALVGDRRYAKGFRLAQRQVEARLQVQTV